MPNTMGGNLLRNALSAPIRQIIENSGLSISSAKESSINGNIYIGGEDFENDRGFDAKRKCITSMWEANIVDPAKVVKNSIKNAISVAGTVLTSEIVITKPKPKQEDMIAQIMGQQQRPF
jgi:chaperonin GroEL